MKSFPTSLIACAIAAFAGTALASSGSLVEFKPQVMPVVVQVNTEGKVTDILPSLQLRPQFRQLLIKQLDGWIVKPATVKGHPVASRFIVEVAMTTKPRKDGKYDASFVYVRSLPLAYGGALHWNVIDGGLELALVSGSPRFPGQRLDRIVDFPTNRIASFTPRNIQPAGVRGTVREASSAYRTASPPQSMPMIAAPPVAAPNAAAAGHSGAAPTERP